jgi:hypothetical protein
MAAPAIPQIPAGYGPLAADLTAWVTTPFTGLTAGALFRGNLQAGQALTGGIETLADLDTILEDPLGGWSAVATASQPAFSWLCPAGWSGWHEICLVASTRAQGTTTSQIDAEVWVSGSLYQVAALGAGVNANGGGACGVVPVPLTGGSDYVQMYIFSTNSVLTPSTAGQYPSMEIAWVST